MGLFSKKRDSAEFDIQAPGGQPGPEPEPEPEPEPAPAEGAAEGGEELWRGELETVKSEKKGSYKWQKRCGLVRGGPGAAIEVHASAKSLSKGKPPELTFEVSGVKVEREEEEHRQQMEQLRLAQLRLAEQARSEADGDRCDEEAQHVCAEEECSTRTFYCFHDFLSFF